jgi:hypothetical protein
VALEQQIAPDLQQVGRVADDAEQAEVEHDHEQRVVDIGLRAVLPIDVVVPAGDVVGLAERVAEREAIE